MEQSTSKVIGKVIQLLGVILIIVGLVIKEPAPGGIGVLVGLIGRVIETYWDEWFD